MTELIAQYVKSREEVKKLKGLVTKSTLPALKPAVIFSDSDSPETKIIGISLVVGSPFNILHTSYPSIPGRIISNKMISGCFVLANSRAFSPFLAMSTVYFSLKISINIVKFVVSSSTNKTIDFSISIRINLNEVLF